MRKNILHKKAMSIIEVMIAIFIFTLWISSVFMIISSTSWIDSYNKNFIIASNLAKEQIELIRNVRDTNYSKFQRWNILQPKDWAGTDYSKVFTGSTSNFYKFENDFSGSAPFHIKSSILASTSSLKNISDFKLALKDASSNIEKYRLCLDSDKNYIYCNWSSVWETPFYKYMEIQKIFKKNGWVNTEIENSFKVNSVVYWNQKWIHKVEIPTILADYKRL